MTCLLHYSMLDCEPVVASGWHRNMLAHKLCLARVCSALPLKQHYMQTAESSERPCIFLCCCNNPPVGWVVEGIGCGIDGAQVQRTMLSTAI